MSERSDSSTVGRTTVLKLGLPLVAAMGGHAFFNLVDLAMVGAYREDPQLAASTIAGVTIASLLGTAPLVFMNGVSNGTVPVIARAFAARNYKRANQFGRQAILLAVLLSVLLGVIPGLFAEEISRLFRAEPGEELTVSTEYLRISCYHAWTGFLLMQVTANMRAIGKGFLPMVLLLTSNIGNIAGNYVLIYGKLGFDEMGAPGAAVATVWARGIALFLAVLVLTRAHRAIRLTLGGWRPRLRFLWSVVGSGMPVALQWTIRLSAVVLILFVIAPFGPAAKAAYGIGTRLETLALFAALGWGAAAAPLVGFAVARGDIPEARKVARQAAFYCALTMAAAGACYWFFPKSLMRLFSLSVETDLGATLAYGTDYLRITVLAYPAVAVVVVWAHALNGAGSVKTPCLIDAVGMMLIQVPLAMFMAGEMGIHGAWWALVISHLLIALVYYFVFRGGAWERKRLR